MAIKLVGTYFAYTLKVRVSERSPPQLAPVLACAAQRETSDGPRIRSISVACRSPRRTRPRAWAGGPWVHTSPTSRPHSPTRERSPTARRTRRSTRSRARGSKQRASGKGTVGQEYVQPIEGPTDGVGPMLLRRHPFRTPVDVELPVARGFMHSPQLAACGCRLLPTAVSAVTLRWRAQSTACVHPLPHGACRVSNCRACAHWLMMRAAHGACVRPLPHGALAEVPSRSTDSGVSGVSGEEGQMVIHWSEKTIWGHCPTCERHARKAA